MPQPAALAIFIQETAGCVPPLAALMTSICANTSLNIAFTVAVHSLQAADQEQLMCSCRKLGSASLEFIHSAADGYPLPILRHLGVLAQTRGLSRAVVMLDDSLVLADISTLFAADLGPWALGAVRDCKLMDSRQSVRTLGRLVRQLHLSGLEAIFDPSLLVIDCQRWLQEGWEQCLAVPAEPQLSCSGWCTTNAAVTLYRCCNGQFLPLDRRWGISYLYASLFLSGRTLDRSMLWRLRYNNPGGARPWLQPDLPGGALFQRYLGQTA